MRSKPNCLNTLQAAGFDYEDACALRRIAMTLHRWHEFECGDSNEWGSWVIVRGRKSHPFDKSTGKRVVQFDHDDNGSPFIERQTYKRHDAAGTTYPSATRYEAIPDRERGALKRLEKIMARYPGFASYVQGDPRGAALYIMRPTDLNGSPAGSQDSPDFREWLSANYSRGIAVFK